MRVIAFLILTLVNNICSAVTISELEISYVYLISKEINIDYIYYCSGDKQFTDNLFSISSERGIIVTSNNYECQVSFNKNIGSTLSFTNDYASRKYYMFLFKLEADKLVVYRNVLKTKDLKIPNHILKLMKTY